MQVGRRVRLTPVQLCQQELPKEVVVAVPLPVVVERGDEEVVLRQAGEQRVGVAHAGHGSAQPGGEAVQDRRAGQEGLQVRRQAVEHLGREVAGDLTLVAAHVGQPVLRRPACVRQHSQIEPGGQPSVSSRSRSRVGSSTVDSCSRRSSFASLRLIARSAAVTSTRPAAARRRASGSGGLRRVPSASCAPCGRWSSTTRTNRQHDWLSSRCPSSSTSRKGLGLGRCCGELREDVLLDRRVAELQQVERRAAARRRPA